MNMKQTMAFMAFLLSISLSYGQELDTLKLYSQAFNQERTVYVHKPKFYKYKSEAVKLPVIYLLDGQHEWFVNPLLSDIQYLQYTKEIPQAIVVVIPLEQRNTECGIVDLHTELPLDTFITKELDPVLQKYHPNDFKLIIGHSFSASFALYSYYRNPEYYAGVIANTPYDEMNLLVKGFMEQDPSVRKGISISIGGIANSKDYYHRKNYEQLKRDYPGFFNSIQVFEANYSAHNAVPIVATPTLLTTVFESFRSRYNHIAKVDDSYTLTSQPQSLAQELEHLQQASTIGPYAYPPEIADINGIASRYWNNQLEAYAVEIYKLGVSYYPKYYEFYLSLYELTFPTNKEASKAYLEKAESLLLRVEGHWDGKNDLLDAIQVEKSKNGW